MKKLKYILSAAILSVAFSGCEDLDSIDSVIDESLKPTVSFSASSTSAIEVQDGEEDTQVIISITLDKPQAKSLSFIATQTGGSAEMDVDYEIDGGILPARAKSTEIVVTVFRDLDVEGDESIDLQIAPGTVTNVYEVLSGSTDLSINIVDYKYCEWTFDGVDVYGDGWNGASIRLSYDGIVRDFTVAEAHDVFTMDVPDGVDYTFEFISGDWDGEVEYTITAPDGTEFSDAYYPAAGVITSGTCN